MIKRVEIVRASNAFIYLPLYAAEQNKMFDSVQQHECRLSGNPIDNLEFKFIPSVAARREGDARAIHDVYQRSRSGKLAFALCDPLEIVGHQTAKSSEFVVFGGIVKKPPFWILSKQTAGNLNELKFKRLITYNHNLTTGHSLAVYAKTRVQGNPELIPTAKVGDEIDYLLKDKSQSLDVGALTTDLIGLSRVLSGISKQYSGYQLTFSFTAANVFENFLTSAFVTTRQVWEKPEGKRAAEILLRGVKHAIALTRISPHVTASLCMQLSSQNLFKPQLKLSPRDKGRDFQTEEADWLAHHLLNEEIYSLDTTITRADWLAAASNGRWGYGEDNPNLKEAKSIFDKVVKNDEDFENESTRKTILTITPDVDLKEIFEKDRRSEKLFLIVFSFALAFAIASASMHAGSWWSSSSFVGVESSMHHYATALFAILLVFCVAVRWQIGTTLPKLRPIVDLIDRSVDTVKRPQFLAYLFLSLAATVGLSFITGIGWSALVETAAEGARQIVANAVTTSATILGLAIYQVMKRARR